MVQRTVDFKSFSFTTDEGAQVRLFADNPLTAATAAVAANGDLTLELTGGADAGTNLLTRAGNTTMGALLDAINALEGISAQLVGSLRADANALLLLVTASFFNLPAGLDLKFDTSVAVVGAGTVLVGFGISQADLKSNVFERRRELVGRPAGGEIADPPDALHELAFLSADVGGTGGTPAIVVTRVKDNGAADVEEQLRSYAITTGTLLEVFIRVLEGKFLSSDRGERLVIRLVATGVTTPVLDAPLLIEARTQRAGDVPVNN